MRRTTSGMGWRYQTTGMFLKWLLGCYKLYCTVSIFWFNHLMSICSIYRLNHCHSYVLEVSFLKTPAWSKKGNLSPFTPKNRTLGWKIWAFLCVNPCALSFQIYCKEWRGVHPTGLDLGPHACFLTATPRGARGYIPPRVRYSIRSVRMPSVTPCKLYAIFWVH